MYLALITYNEIKSNLSSKCAMKSNQTKPKYGAYGVESNNDLPKISDLRYIVKERFARNKRFTIYNQLILCPKEGGYDVS